MIPNVAHLGRALVVSALIPSLGCVVWMRDPEPYRDELVELIEEREEAVQQCYDAALTRTQLDVELRERDAQGAYADIGPAVTEQIAAWDGSVIVEFQIAAETGQVRPVAVEDARTTAPAPAVACVVEAMEGLTIEPADGREARITLAFSLDVGRAAKTRPGDEGASAEAPASP